MRRRFEMLRDVISFAACMFIVCSVKVAIVYPVTWLSDLQAARAQSFYTPPLPCPFLPLEWCDR